MTVKEKLASLREAMKNKNIDAFIVYSSDPHKSEYLPDEWQEREWISGFTGSAGFVVVTIEKAGLWTDGRYFTQAPIELAGSGIDLFKMGVDGTPNYIDWIISQTKENANVAVNALATANQDWEAVFNRLKKYQRNLKDIPLLNEVWKDRGNPVKNEVFVHPIERAGQSVTDKITAIREKMKTELATAHVISSLDDVAWTLNLRGSDVECNPVFLGYIYIDEKQALLYVDEEKLNEEAKELMKHSNVSIRPYASFFEDLQQIKGENIMLAPTANQAVFHTLKENNKIVKRPVPGNLMKAVKNEAELEGFRKVMVRDGVAMVKFLHWLTHTVGKQEINEYEIGERLLSFRKEGENFVGESFSSIVGFQGNGAIIHYKAPKEGSAQVKKEGSILVDSGGQYLEGTTDITRTFPLGEVSDEFKHDSTLALKGFIQLSMAKFPKGTCGTHLDAYARKPLWEEGKDYNHGTGHGVGSFLNVHEGPQSIRKDLTAIVLEEGMVCSNEPGYYLEGKYGIRHENLIAVKTWKKTQWNTFYEFETLTLCPFFKNAIQKEIVTDEEIEWLNNYHKTVKEKLLPHLSGEVKEWFLEMVSPL